MRHGFSMITAIIFIVLVATLGALALSLSTQTTKQTNDLYLHAQAELLAQSATEYALLAFSAHEINSTNGCLEQVNAHYPQTDSLFDINITLSYLGNGLPCSAGAIINNTISTKDSNLTLIVDTFVTTNKGVTTEPIRIHRRTLQKP